MDRNKDKETLKDEAEEGVILCLIITQERGGQMDHEIKDIQQLWRHRNGTRRRPHSSHSLETGQGITPALDVGHRLLVSQSHR